MKRIEIQRVDSRDLVRMRELAKHHEATGEPFIVHDEKIAACTEGVKMPELSGLLALFGTVGDGYLFLW